MDIAIVQRFFPLVQEEDTKTGYVLIAKQIV